MTEALENASWEERFLVPAEEVKSTRLRWFNATGKVNAYRFRGHPPGTVLFLGATWSVQAGWLADVTLLFCPTDVARVNPDHYDTVNFIALLPLAAQVGKQ